MARPFVVLFLIAMTLTGWSHAEQTTPAIPRSAPTLLRELEASWPRRHQEDADHRDFLVRLGQFLRSRADEGVRFSLSSLVPVLHRYGTTSLRLSDVFQTLAEEENGLGVDEVAALVMDGGFEEFGDPMSALRAFQRMTQNLNQPQGTLSPRHRDLLRALAPFVRDYADFVRLLNVPGADERLRDQVVRVLLVEAPERLDSWHLSPQDWAKILVHYAPERPDVPECRRIVAPLRSVFDVREALRFVRDDASKLCLQEAAVLELKGRWTHGRLRTLLAPLDEWPTLEYAAGLADLSARYLARARGRECAHLLVRWSDDRPHATSVAERPADWRVITGGRTTPD